MSRLLHTAIALVAALSLTVLSGSVAVANDADVIRRGSCSGYADWKLKASPENGRIEVEGEVDTSHNGRVWRWRIRHDGGVSARGKKTTHRPSGSFTVRRVLVNRSGRDAIGWRAKNRRTGQTCRGFLRF